MKNKIALLGLVISIAIALFSLISYQHETQQVLHLAKLRAENEAVRVVKGIEPRLEILMKQVEAIANDLSTNQIKDRQIVDRLISTMQVNPSFFGLGAAYLPFQFDPNIELYGPYYAKRQGNLQILQMENFYDYTKAKWFQNSLKSWGWIEPFYDQTSDTLIALYVAPFYQKDSLTQEKKIKGLIYGSYSLDDLKDLMDSLNLGKTGYGFILSKLGTYIYHPITQLVQEQQSIFQQATIQKSPKLKEMGEKSIKGERGFIEYANLLTGQESWIFYEPILATNWTLAVVSFKDELYTPRQSINRLLIWICLGAIGCLFFLMVLAWSDRWWLLSILTSLLYIMMIGLIWYLTLNYKIPNQGILLTDANVRGYLNYQSRITKKITKVPPIFIPTGILVQSIEFSNANDVIMTGYIWQKYYKKLHDNINRDFIFPQSIAINKTPIYHITKEQYEVIGWRFVTTIRQEFNYAKYPFDTQNLSLEIIHPHLERDVILVPDFAGYTIISPSSRPGLIEQLVLPEWNIERSYFQYKINNYKTNFGIEGISRSVFPDLHFTIVIQRKFLTVFLSYMIRLLVIAVLLFAIAMIIRKNHDNQIKYLGYNTLTIISSTGGFIIFVLTVDQRGIREKIAAIGVVYLEYFYFVLYGMILLVAVNALLYALDTQLPLITMKDNLIPKLLYWPILTLFFLIATLLVFY